MIDRLPSLAGSAWLAAPATQRALACLNRDGQVARVVGGAVRNTLLGRPVADIDIATTAEPGQVIAAATAAGLKTFATGLAHGTVTIVVDGTPFEVTTLRHDVETDGRHATVAFTDDWAADAARRDLTLNALYCDADGSLFDPIGGLADVLARRVRFIGDAHQRIREDYLRILRFFRFTAQYAEAPPDRIGLEAAVAERHGLGRLSAERVRAELVRLLVAPGAVGVVEAMASHGLLTAILPVAPRLGLFARLVTIEQDRARAADPMLRLACLAVAVEEDVERLAEGLRLSGEERGILHAIATSPPLSPALAAPARHAALYHFGATAFQRRVSTDWAAAGAASDDADWLDLFDLPARWSVPKLPFSGRDLIARGLAPGRAVGEILTAFENWWIEADFPTEPAMLAAALERCMRAVRS